MTDADRPTDAREPASRVTISLIPVTGMPEIQARRRPGGPDRRSGCACEDGDVVVVTQKVVSKAEGRLVAVDPDDPLRHKALVYQEAVRILRRRGDLMMTETRHGFVCANAGIDLSNVERGWAALLPRRLRPLGPAHPRRPAGPGRRSRSASSSPTPSAGPGGGASPTWPSASPAWPRIVDLRGTTDALGRELAVTEVCVADELAGAAELVMGKASGIPVAVVRGVDPAWLREGSVRDEIVRPYHEDLFR